MSEKTFMFFLCLFSHLKNLSNSQTHILIWLKFGKLLGQQEAIININFGENS